VNFYFTRSFKKDYRALSDEHQKQVDRAIELLNEDWRHPGLEVKKVKSLRGVWEARASAGYRMTFTCDGKSCILRRVGSHDVLRKP
jgi:mRNA-degrading endonuclease RelE of RelBE toxin-antitoxin system